MSEIVLMSDTACDLPLTLINKYDIKLIPFYVSFDADTYAKEIVDLSIATFYETMRKDKIFPKTSLPSVSDYVDAFTPIVKNNQKIICVCLSSHFSGSYNSAANARELILEHYPDAQIAIINSLNATAGQGLLVQEIARMIEKGISFDIIIDTAEKLKESARIFFFVETLDYLEHGGRIGKVSALIGTMLNIKPIIYLQDGILFPLGKVRGTKKALSKLLEHTADYVGQHAKDYNYFVVHADNIEYANTLHTGLYETLNIEASQEFPIIGATIGVNTGPDVGGVCLIKKFESIHNN